MTFENQVNPPMDEVLEHHGVKGQKWGVRRNEKTGARPIAVTLNNSKFGQKSIARAEKHGQKVQTKVDKKAAKADDKWQKNIYTLHGAIDVHNHVADQMNHGVLDKLNADPRWKNMDLINRPNEPVAKSYMQAYESRVEKATAEAVKGVHGVSPSGKYKATLDTSNPEQWAIKVVSTDDKVTHADGDVPLPPLTMEINHDAKGLITSMKQIKTAAAHGEEFVTAFLAHTAEKDERLQSILAAVGNKKLSEIPSK